jgi:hypothetical protein
MGMTSQQVRTVKRLGVALGIFVALVVWLLYTEGAAIVQGGHSTITEVVQLAFAHQPWVFVLLGVVLVAIVAFLAGHFFAAPASHYERLRRGGVVLALASLPFLIGCKDCEQLQAALVLARASGNAAAIEAAEKAIAKAGCNVPEQPPATPTPPAPVNCLTFPACPEGQHCEQGVGCVPDPLPDPPIVCGPDQQPQVLDGKVVGCLPYLPPAAPVPASACPKPLAEGAVVYVNNKRHGNGIDSTVRVKGDAELCRLVHGVSTPNCHLEGWPQRAACELELAGGCPIWEYSMDGQTKRGACLQPAHDEASCSHFGDPTFRDDPLTPTTGDSIETIQGFEGQPLACGLQRDRAGNPLAGFFAIGHGKAWFRACLPDGTGCGPWVLGKDNR